MANYLDQAIQNLRRFEGSVPWMYLDTVGKVTVGVGLMLANETSAHALPFFIGERQATPAEISKEFLRVAGMKLGQPAKVYRRSNGAYLKDDAINTILGRTLLGSEAYLRSHVPGYDALPDAAKLALLDMIYNLGPGHLFAEYPRFFAAIERGDWKAAALSSSRRGPAPERNAWTRQQFLDAAASVLPSVKAGGEGTPWTAVLLGIAAAFAGAGALAILLGEFDRDRIARGAPSTAAPPE